MPYGIRNGVRMETRPYGVEMRTVSTGFVIFQLTLTTSLLPHSRYLKVVYSAALLIDEQELFRRFTFLTDFSTSHHSEDLVLDCLKPNSA